MPHPSTNSSSTLTQEEQDEHINYRDSHKLTETGESTTDNINDLHYGTEELLDALPRVWTRGVFYALLGFAVIGLPWARQEVLEDE
jgi:hemolysin D